MDTIELWFNSACSKCRATRARLDESGLAYRVFEYLETPPDRARLEAVLQRLGSTEDPATLARTGDDAWSELGLDGADAQAVVEALVAHPRLIQRPIAVWRDEAVVCRPPERIDPLLARVRDDG